MGALHRSSFAQFHRERQHDKSGPCDGEGTHTQKGSLTFYVNHGPRGHIADLLCQPRFAHHCQQANGPRESAFAGVTLLAAPRLVVCLAPASCKAMCSRANPRSALRTADGPARFRARDRAANHLRVVPCGDVDAVERAGGQAHRRAWAVAATDWRRQSHACAPPSPCSPCCLYDL